MRAVLALVALVLLVAAFAALAPATLVDARVAALTRGSMRLADAAGTVWSGSGALADARGRWRMPIAWHLDAMALLRSGVRLELVPSGDATARGTISARDDTVEMKALHVEVPAAAVESAWSRPPVPDLEGTVVVDAPSFYLGAANAAGSLDVHWDRARVALLGVALDLGSVEANARPGGGGVVVALRNRGGDIALRGEARIEGSAMSLDATLTPMPGMPQPALLALQMLGRPAADGSVRIAWRGQR